MVVGAGKYIAQQDVFRRLVSPAVICWHALWKPRKFKGRAFFVCSRSSRPNAIDIPVDVQLSKLWTALTIRKSKYYWLQAKSKVTPYRLKALQLIEDAQRPLICCEWRSCFCRSRDINFAEKTNIPVVSTMMNNAHGGKIAADGHLWQLYKQLNLYFLEFVPSKIIGCCQQTSIFIVPAVDFVCSAIFGALVQHYKFLFLNPLIQFYFQVQNL